MLVDFADDDEAWCPFYAHVSNRPAPLRAYTYAPKRQMDTFRHLAHLSVVGLCPGIKKSAADQETDTA